MTKRYNSLITEISKKTLGSYVQKSAASAAGHARKASEHLAKTVDNPDRRDSERHNDAAIDHQDKEVKRHDGIARATKRLTAEDFDRMSESEFDDVCENFEQLDEISKKTLGSYLKKSHKEYGLARVFSSGNRDERDKKEAGEVAKKRSAGIHRAIDKLTKEDVNLDEAFQTGDTVHGTTPHMSGKMHGKVIKHDDQHAHVEWDLGKDGKHVSKYRQTSGRTVAGNLAVPNNIHKSDVKEAIEYPVINARSPADQEFVGAHPVDKTDDANGNGDAVFKGTTSKDKSRIADKWTGDDDADDSASETGLDTAGTYHNKVNEEQLQEISKKVLGSYIKKAGSDQVVNGMKMGAANGSEKSYTDAVKGGHKAIKRNKGIAKATDKLMKEDEDLQELSKKTLGRYIMHATQNYAHHSHEREKARENSQLVGRMSHNAAAPVRKATDDAQRALDKDANAHDDKRHKRGMGISKAVKRLTKEDFEQMDENEFADVCENFEQLDEISKETLKSYVKKATSNNARRERILVKQDKIMRPNDPGWDDTRDRAAKVIGKHIKKFHRRRNSIELANTKLKEDMGESNGTSVSNETDSGTPKVHVTTGDKKHTVHRQRTMSSSHYVVHDHQSGNKKTFPYTSDVVDYLNDNGHGNLNSKHFQSLH